MQRPEVCRENQIMQVKKKRVIFENNVRKTRTFEREILKGKKVATGWRALERSSHNVNDQCSVLELHANVHRNKHDVYLLDTVRNKKKSSLVVVFLYPSLGNGLHI